MTTSGASPDRRYNEYVSRLIANIVAVREGEGGKEKGRRGIRKGR
jgi:hypothetical protein